MKILKKSKSLHINPKIKQIKWIIFFKVANISPVTLCILNPFKAIHDIRFYDSWGPLFSSRKINKIYFGVN